MIPVRVESLVIGMMPGPSVVSLRPNEGSDPSDMERVLSIWIGPMEAIAIAAALDPDKPERPLTHQFLNSMLFSAGAQVNRVVLDRVEGTTVFSTVYLRRPDGMFTRVDARPSDAIALAVTAQAPLYVEEKVMDAASSPSSFKPGADRKIEIEEFHKFIENINPEDFVASSSTDAE